VLDASAGEATGLDAALPDIDELVGLLRQ